MQAWFARKSFELRKTWKKQGMKYYTTLLGAAGAAVDKTREKPDITLKLDMMSMRNDAPRTGRTIQVAKKKAVDIW